MWLVAVAASAIEMVLSLMAFALALIMPLGHGEVSMILKRRRIILGSYTMGKLI